MSHRGGLLNVPLITEWTNDDLIDDHKPAAVMGRAAANIPMAYAGRSPGYQPGINSDLIDIYGTVIDSSPHFAEARPALSYLYEPAALNPDYVVVAWEKIETQGGQKNGLGRREVGQCL